MDWHSNIQTFPPRRPRSQCACPLPHAQAWGKCDADFIKGQGFCDATCGRCTPGGAAPASPSPALPSSPSPAPTKTSAAAPAGGPSAGSPFAPADYASVLGLSFRFFDAQRSGALPANFPVTWRRSSHLNDSVPGGFYDAGDYLKLK